MGTTMPAGRPTIAARRVGYTVATVIGMALLYAVNVQPGWRAVPFLTEDVRQVLWLVNLSLVTGFVANVVYLAYDPKWMRYVGELINTVIGLAMSIRVLQVFPFAFDDPSVDWALITRTVLIVAAVVTALATVVNLATLARRTTGR
ncbi:hypothetical protein [Streptosporangium sp. NPDC049376]|uniref:hypothetical protein n=1 Tax=Streptosporangium sp. NPDC049376 TaxID=3366192 RepID=UPI003791ADAD